MDTLFVVVTVGVLIVLIIAAITKVIGGSGKKW
jgi:hypothetical protein